MVRHNAGDRVGVLGSVDLDDADAKAAGGIDGILGNDAVPGEPVALRQRGVADPLAPGQPPAVAS